MVTQKKSRNTFTKKYSDTREGFVVIPLDDMQKVKQVGIGLQSYWLDCWSADPFGTRWVELSDDPANTTKAKYRQQLEELGLFLFEKRGDRGSWRIYCINLRGSRAHLGKKCLLKYVDHHGMPNVPQETVERLNALLKLECKEEGRGEAVVTNGCEIQPSALIGNLPEEIFDVGEDFFDEIEQETAETPVDKESIQPLISPQELLTEEVLEVDIVNSDKQLPTDIPDVWRLRKTFEAIEAGQIIPDAQMLDQCYFDVALQVKISNFLVANPQLGLAICYGKVMNADEATLLKKSQPDFMQPVYKAIDGVRSAKLGGTPSRIKEMRQARWHKLRNI